MDVSNVSSSDSTSPRNVLKQDWTALQNALQANDLNGAQQAFASFQEELQSIQQQQGTQKTHGHHRHHHHHRTQQVAGTTSTSQDTTTNGTANNTDTAALTGASSTTLS